MALQCRTGPGNQPFPLAGSGGPFGAYGDSLTTAPSWVAPLQDLLDGYSGLILASGGWTSANLLTAIPSSSIPMASVNSVVLIGVNDLLAEVPEATIIANLESIITLIPNPRVVTILPFGAYTGWDSGKEAARQTVNAWILANTQAIDAESMGSGDPPSLLPEYDSGDGLHINSAGDTALASLIFTQGNW